MKASVHPTYFSQANVTCVCGNKFTTGSTMENIRVEICSNCHPLYTGQQKLIDTQGQVEKFQKAQAIAKVKKVERAAIEENRNQKQQARRSDSDRPSLKDLLIKARKS